MGVDVQSRTAFRRWFSFLLMVSPEIGGRISQKTSGKLHKRVELFTGCNSVKFCQNAGIFYKIRDSLKAVDLFP